MPRTRLFWHLFVGWCAAVLVTLGAGFWIASVQFAGLADDALAARLTDSARALVATLPAADPSADREGFRQAAAALERSSGIRCTLASDAAAAEGKHRGFGYVTFETRSALRRVVAGGLLVACCLLVAHGLCRASRTATVRQTPRLRTVTGLRIRVVQRREALYV
jgi:hypothetical protein